ncbi:zinc finger protein 726-like [Anopheles nili]|uniref:zinc finger protein 726-like n=1 Tax=Anopheles nili TaxID=185578 RepID=UPI00237C46CA|nr:zinc finger protein 726-like [Anopheles nili]
MFQLRLNEEYLLLCRLCLECDDTEYVSIYDKHENEAFSKIIKTCIGIKIRKNDGLTQFICTNCRNELVKFYKIRKKSFEVDKILRALRSTVLLAAFICCGCNSSTEFDSQEDLDAHCEKEHKKYRITDNSIRPFECNVCFQRFLSETLLKHHRERAYRKRPYICRSCATAFFTNSALKRHEKMCNVVGSSYTCEQCGKRFRQILTLNNHRKLHQTEKTFSCPICAKTFKQKFEIPIHMITHTGEQPYPCDQCPARFKRKQALKNHQRHHLNPRPFKCTTCDEWFGSAAARKFHQQTVHEGLDPFRCEQCGISYGRRLRLTQHRKKFHGDSL